MPSSIVKKAAVSKVNKAVFVIKDIEVSFSDFTQRVDRFVEHATVQRKKKEARRAQKNTVISRDCCHKFAAKDQLVQHYGGISHKQKVKTNFEKTQEYHCKI